MSSAKKILLGFFVFIIALIAFFYLRSYIINKERQPELNPHPKYFVTITGNIAPNLKYPMYMAFWATYGGYNPKCKVSISYFDGVEGLPGHPVFYPAKPDSKGNYTVKIPIDRYKPGRCNWKIAWIDFSFRFRPYLPDKDKAGGVGTLMQFGRYPEEQPAISTDKYNTLYGCIPHTMEMCQGDSFTSGYVKYVSRKKSYYFVQNIKA